jgi:hypothetical protein
MFRKQFHGMFGRTILLSRMLKSFFAAALVSVLAFSTACGSSGSSSISQAQAQAVSHEVVTAVEAAISATASAQDRNAHATLGELLARPRPETSSGCTTTENGTDCTISYSGTCPGGGTIAVAGNFDVTLNSSGDGSDSFTLTVTPASCSVSNLTINGDPAISVATKLTFQAGQPVFPITATETGGISYGPNPSGTCSMNVMISVNSASTCTVSGTVCGQTVSGNC